MQGMRGKRGSSVARLGGLGAAAVLAMAAGGCKQHSLDSYMDPSVVGRWERTPTSVPILDRIASIEDEAGEFVEYDDPTPEDLEPVAKSYRISSGDLLEVTIFDIVTPDRPEIYELTVDGRGMVEIPQLGRVPASGLTLEEFRRDIELRIEPLVGSNPLVQITPRNQRGQTFNLIGAVGSPGPYFVPKPDFRLLEALTAGGNFDQTSDEIYVIRQVSLTGAGEEASPGEPGVTPSAPSVPSEPGRDLQRLIDDLTRPTGGTQSQPSGEPQGGVEPAPASPGAMGRRGTSRQDGRSRPAREAVIGLQDGLGAMQPGDEVDAARAAGPEPVVPLRDGLSGGEPTGGSGTAGASSGPRWVFIDGKWQQVRVGGPRGGTTATPGSEAASPTISTQRVIRIPLQPLLAGSQQYNIVVRPGDIVRVPAPPSGFYYVTGQVNNPGPFNLPPSGRTTIMRAIDSARGLSGLAIPERVDLTRMVGRDRQATIMLDLRAIAEGTQPDVFVKPNDRINVGTTWWATPLAVIRNGFRASYGFGLLIDRNFGNDIFGAPPDNRFGTN